MKKRYKILIGIVALLVIIRLLLPFVVLHYANKALANLDGYNGKITDIDLAIYRGAYTIKDIYVNKVDSATSEETEFFKSNLIDLSVEWNAIFDGEIVGELLIDSPVLVFSKDKVEPEEITKDSADFRQILEDFMPLRINHFEVNNGELRYADEFSAPKVDLAITQLNILAHNLSNVSHDTIPLPSTIQASARVYEGKLEVNVKLNLMLEQLTFDMDAELANTKLPLLNNFLKAYANFDVSEGTFGLYTEVAAKEGEFVGYVKPIIKDLKVVGPEDKKDGFLNKVYEHIVGAGAELLENQRKDQVATKVNIAGNFEDPKVGIWSAVFKVLRNAFIQALIPSIDHEINMETISNKEPADKSNFIEGILNSDED